jgi:hypothetical protein
MRAFLCIAFIIPFISWNQGNLVPNSSFEDKSSCFLGIPSMPGGGGVSDWFVPNISTPDYFNECAFPLATLQAPHSDSAYVGMATYDPNMSNMREYVSCSLLDTLQAGTTYWVKFYTSVGEGYSSVASNNLGIHFSDTALHSASLFYIDVDAQIKYFNNEIIDDTLNWVKVCGLYQAQGGEAYLTIGNFNTDAETTEGVQYTPGWDWQTYFLIDDVSVIPLDSIVGGMPVDAGPDKTIYIGDTAFIGQKISNMPDNWFTLSGTSLDTNVAGVYVSPTVNTTYVVTRDLNGFYSTDTVTVFVNGLGLEEDDLKHFTLAPNPSSGLFLLIGDGKGEYFVRIHSLDGKGVFESALQKGTTQNSLDTGLPAGSYILQLENKQGKIVFRERMAIK